MLITYAIAAVLISTPASNADEAIEKKLDVCLYPSNIAKAVMTRRQNGGSLSELMAKIPDLGMQPAIEDLAKKLAIAAYGVPAYSDEKFQQAAITEFESQTYLNCAKGIN